MAVAALELVSSVAIGASLVVGGSGGANPYPLGAPGFPGRANPSVVPQQPSRQQVVGPQITTTQILFPPATGGANPAGARPVVWSRFPAPAPARTTPPPAVAAGPTNAPPTNAAPPRAVAYAPPPPLDPVEEWIKKQEITRRVVATQKANAEKGSPTAQFDLGMRYLTGDWLEQDWEIGLQWLKAAAVQGHDKAVKTLADLDKKLEDLQLRMVELEKPPLIDL